MIAAAITHHRTGSSADRGRANQLVDVGVGVDVVRRSDIEPGSSP